MKNLIVANWKMNPTSQKEAEDIFSKIKEGAKDTSAEVIICPPFIYLSLLKGLTLGAQDCFYEDKGTFTGEISPVMLKGMGVEYVIIGHSERRKNGETNEVVNKKLKKALGSGLNAILCIGETMEQREAGETEGVLEDQLNSALEGVSVSDKINVAYEPLWAISTGDPYKTKELPTPEKIKKIGEYIKGLLVKVYGGEAGKIRMIYGGSANGQNAKSYLQDGGMQGLLVGGASLKPEEFIKIVKSAE